MKCNKGDVLVYGKRLKAADRHIAPVRVWFKFVSTEDQTCCRSLQSLFSPSSVSLSSSLNLSLTPFCSIDNSQIQTTVTNKFTEQRQETEPGNSVMTLKNILEKGRSLYTHRKANKYINKGAQVNN